MDKVLHMPLPHHLDVLAVEGRDVPDKPFIQRKQWLKAILPDLMSFNMIAP